MKGLVTPHFNVSCLQNMHIGSEAVADSSMSVRLGYMIPSVPYSQMTLSRLNMALLTKAKDTLHYALMEARGN